MFYMLIYIFIFTNSYLQVYIFRDTFIYPVFMYPFVVFYVSFYTVNRRDAEMAKTHSQVNLEAGQTKKNVLKFSF